jgi:hypothetical protein
MKSQLALIPDCCEESLCLKVLLSIGQGLSKSRKKKGEKKE